MHLVHKAGRTYEANGDTNGENKNEAHGKLFFGVRERIEQESQQGKAGGSDKP